MQLPNFEEIREEVNNDYIVLVITLETVNSNGLPG